MDCLLHHLPDPLHLTDNTNLDVVLGALPGPVDHFSICHIEGGVRVFRSRSVRQDKGYQSCLLRGERSL